MPSSVAHHKKLRYVIYCTTHHSSTIYTIYNLIRMHMIWKKDMQQKQADQDEVQQVKVDQDEVQLKKVNHKEENDHRKKWYLQEMDIHEEMKY